MAERQLDPNRPKNGNPLVKWRVASAEQVKELANALPKEEMPEIDFRIKAGALYNNSFLTTGYQLACQLGLYYISDDKIYHPRFNRDIDDLEAKEYYRNWMLNYYVPNPYTKQGFNNLDKPISIVRSLVEYIEQYNGNAVSFSEACTAIFKEDVGTASNSLKGALNNLGVVFNIEGDNISLKPNYKDYMEVNANRNDKKAFFDAMAGITVPQGNAQPKKSQFNLQLLAAIRTKPFVLLAGISGTGKSRIVRELARACYQAGSEEYKAHKPKNFEMIQVKPNWQDSTELIGYVSRIGKEPEFIAGDFLKFIVRAWKDPNTPYFLCLDEMNLAPVEQYFAEYLSVIESRKFNGEKVVTDPILRKSEDPWYHTLAATLTGDNENLRVKFLEDGISLPQNLIVVGTVNMDETTYSFSRKVLDRAMTVEMNEVNYKGGLKKNSANEFGFLGNTIIGQAVEGCDVYDTYTDVCDSVIEYLESVDEKLKDTPFRVAYRTRNEFLVYTINRIARAKNDPDFKQEEVINHAIDEMTSMKILSRIEGDRTKTESALKGIKNVLVARIGDLESISLKKIEFMLKRLDSEYTSFWA